MRVDGSGVERIDIERPVDLRTFAALADVSLYTARAWARQGTLKAFRLGRRWMMAPGEVRRVLTGGVAER
jgi:hypothetical protein